MNERQAHQEGLHFTGIYSHDKEHVKTQILELRKLYPKARIVLVSIPPDPLSRSSHGIGYSAYADKIYSAYQTIKDNAPIVANHVERLFKLEEKYKSDITDEYTKTENSKQKIREAQEIIDLA